MKISLAQREHPFLFIGKKEIERAKVRAKKYAWAKRQLKLIVKQADERLTKKIKFKPTDNHPSGWLDMDNLGIAYALTGREAYAEKAREILLYYGKLYATLPLKTEKFAPREKTKHMSYAQLKARWPQAVRASFSTLREAAYGISVVWGYDLIYNSPCLSDEDRKIIENGFLRPLAHEISLNPRGAKCNWQSWHNAAMISIGLCIGDEKLVARAIDEPKNGFRRQLRVGVFDSGFWNEGTAAYHYYALSALRMTADAAFRAGIDLYKDGTLKKMYEIPFLYAFPDLTFPAVNDSDLFHLGERHEFYELAYARFGGSKFLAAARLAKRDSLEALFWGVEKLPTASPLPASKSRNFPGIGAAVLRQGSGKDRLYVHFDYGPHGGWHGHPDKLSIILFGLGRRLAPDAGRVDYNDPLYNPWYKQTFAHNTICVDRKSQQPATGKLTMFNSQQGFTIAQARCDSAYTGVKMKRTVALSDNYLIDIFSVTSDEEHTYDWVYHNFGKLVPALPVKSFNKKLGKKDGYQHVKDITRAKTDKTWSADFKQDGANVRLTMLDAEGTELFFGTGYVDNPSKSCPLIVARRKGKTTTFISVIEPYRKSPGITGLRTISVNGAKSAIALEITRMSKKDLFMLADRIGLERTFGGIKTKAKACFASDVVNNKAAKLYHITKVNNDK